MREEPCTILSDTIPAVVHGRATWTREEAEHLAECGACRAELELAQTAFALGRRADALVDPPAVAEAVTKQLRRSARRPRVIRRLVWAGGAGALAAAAALVIALRTTVPTVDRPPPEAAVLSVQMPGIDSLSVTELEWVLESLDEPIDAGSTLGGPGLDELDDGELERLLRAWEG